ncbi:MAG: hypothetical protein J7M26_09875, partial [Armatimonadetes bacterium]|nr:hypothetical protein [Armatimonadota bacterium]
MAHLAVYTPRGPPHYAPYSPRGIPAGCGWAWTQHRAVPQILYSGFAVDILVNHKYCSDQANRWREQGIGPDLPASVLELHTQALRLKTTALYYIFGNDPLLPEAITITAG